MGSPRLAQIGLALLLLTTGCGSNQVEQTSSLMLQANQPAPTGVGSGSITDGWYSYASTQGRYVAKFPGKPQEESQAIATPTGNSDLFLVIYEDKANNRAYAISHNRLQLPEGAKLDIEKGLDGSRDGIARGVGATVTQEIAIRRSTYTGREVLMSRAGKMTGKARIFYANGILYQAFVLLEGTDLNQVPEVNAFLDSVQLTK